MLLFNKTSCPWEKKIILSQMINKEEEEDVLSPELERLVAHEEHEMKPHQEETELINLGTTEEKKEVKVGTDERENTTFAQKINRPNSLKIVPNGVANCRNLPFGGRATRGSRVTTNIYLRKTSEKPERCGLRTLIVKGSRVVFTHGEGFSTPRVHHKGRQPLIKCANMTSECFIFPFFIQRRRAQ